MSGFQSLFKYTPILKCNHLLAQDLKISTRGISLTACFQGKKNFRKFSLGNKRGTRIFKRMRNEGKFPDMPIETEVRPIGYNYKGAFIMVPEMIPEFIVPDLTGFELKPYVSYRAQDIYQTEFTPQDLFDAVYKQKILKDKESGKLEENGNPLEPSEEEKLTPEEAYIAAKKTGSDLFSERIPKRWECLDLNLVMKQPKQFE